MHVQWSEFEHQFYFVLTASQLPARLIFIHTECPERSLKFISTVSMNFFYMMNSPQFFVVFFFLLYIFFSICLFLAKAAMLTKAYEGNKGISIEGELWDLQNSVYWEKMCNGKKQSRALRVRGARAAHGISGELQELKPAINLASCPENTSPASYAFVWSIPTSVAMRWCYALNTGPANTYFAKNRHSLQRSYSLLNLPNVYWSSWPGLSPVCTSSCLLVAFL